MPEASRDELIAHVMAAASQSPQHVKFILENSYGANVSPVSPISDHVSRMQYGELKGLADYLVKWQAANEIEPLKPGDPYTPADLQDKEHQPTPIGPPNAVRQELSLGLEQLSVSDLVKLLAEASRGAKECDIWIFWKNDEYTHIRPEGGQTALQRLGSVTRTEEIRRVRVYVVFPDKSQLDIAVGQGRQRITSVSETGNSAAQSRLSALEGLPKQLSARRDDRAERARKRKGRLLIGLNILYGLFAATFLVQWNINHRPYSVLWWASGLLAVASQVTLQVAARRQPKIPELDPIVRDYPAQPPESKLSRRNIVDAAQVVGAIAGVLALLWTILH